MRQNSPSSCPTCRQTSSINDLAPTNRIVRNMLDRLLVKCPRCAQMSVRRDQFARHRRRTCPKISICCVAAEMRCAWTGTMAQLESPLSSCAFHPFENALEEMTSENCQLKEEPIRQTLRFDDLRSEVERPRGLSNEKKFVNKTNNDCW